VWSSLQETLYWFDGCERRSHGNGSLVVQASSCVVDDGSRTCTSLSASWYGQLSSDPAYIVGIAVTSFTVLIVAGYCLAKRRPRRGASVFLILVLPALLWRPKIFAANLVHLGLTAGLGIGQLGTTPRVKDNSFVVYDWSVGFAGGPNIFLIHDVSDGIALPMAQHKQPQSSENGFGEECAGKVERLAGHYYVCTI
jgi:hypothetical protein